MGSPSYTLGQQFLQISAVGMQGARHGDAADPIAITVAVVKGFENTDDENRVETVIWGPDTQNRVRRVRTGHWIFKLDPSLLEIGAAYTVLWQFQMSAGVVNVAHRVFTWNPLPEVPYEPENTIIYGTMVDTLGMPMSGQSLVMETYNDVTTLTKRTEQLKLTADAFGHWFVEIPKGTVVRFVFGDLSKIVQAPSTNGCTALSDLQAFQPRDIAKRDKYGYPTPDQDIFKLLAASLTQSQALAVVQTQSVIQVIEDSGNGSLDGKHVEIFKFEQNTPLTPWIILHNKDCIPVVSVLDENDSVVLADVQYPDRNTVIITFQQPTTGVAILVCTVDGQETPL